MAARGAAQAVRRFGARAQILELIAEGLTAPEIARRLHLSVSTVKSHLGHLYEKLGVCERAVAVAMRRGLLI